MSDTDVVDNFTGVARELHSEHSKLPLRDLPPSSRRFFLDTAGKVMTNDGGSTILPFKWEHLPRENGRKALVLPEVFRELIRLDPSRTDIVPARD